MAAEDLQKLPKPKISKPKGGYFAMVNLAFQSWLKDIKIQVEDCNLTQRENIQLVKDITAQHACNKVEFYIGMDAEGQ